MRIWVLCILGLATAVSSAGTVSLTSGKGLTVLGNPRSAIRRDIVEAAVLRLRSGDPYPLARMDWKPVSADSKGEFTGAFTEGGYVWCTYDSPDDRVVFLEAQGPSVSYANWAPRAGDPYSFGYVSSPVKLRRGRNDFLFACGRGRLEAKLVDPPHPVSIDVRDATVPTIDPVNGLLTVNVGVVVRNATEWEQTVRIDDTAPDGRLIAGWPLVVPPMSSRKVSTAVLAAAGDHTLSVAGTPSSARLTVPSSDGKGSQKATFTSAVDDSVQYYAFNPSTKPGVGQALFLSLHGASVEAFGQAQAYGPHDWGTLVAATNRRPFGFDWEEVGRLDALEVLEQGKQRFRPNPEQIYLTGHSMGGHGTWSIGSLYPDKFAAIMPSAGWISFSTYVGGAKYNVDNPLEAVLARFNNVYETMKRKQNLFMPAVYVVHGDADDNVPVEQARTMIKALEGHPNLKWHEEKGAGHWWDKDPAPGADCVDWKPGFELFKSVTLPDAAVAVDFTTPDPWVSPTCRWVRIGEQEKPLEMSSVRLRLNFQTVTGSTSNVLSMAIGLRQVEKVVLDGQTVPLYGVGPYGLMKVDGQWKAVSSTRVGAVPHSAKSVFANHVKFVVGTGGTLDERNATRELAQYWQETYQYRANAGIEVLSDVEAVKRGFAAGGPNVVLFGRPDTNALWKLMSSRFAVRLSRDEVAKGSRKEQRDDLAYIGLADLGKGRLALGVGGTGPTGLRLAARAPIFTSGAAFPDVLVWSPEMLSSGTPGLVLAGVNAGDHTGRELAWR